MKKKQPWMFRGAIVLASGKLGTITHMQENSIDGVDYVYYIDVRLNGAKGSGTYHPGDIEEAKEGVIS